VAPTPIKPLAPPPTLVGQRSKIELRKSSYARVNAILPPFTVDQLKRIILKSPVELQACKDADIQKINYSGPKSDTLSPAKPTEWRDLVIILVIIILLS
jgi:hypothetical protein